MIKEIDIYISRFINQLTIRNKLLADFLKLITHTSSGKIYPVYALLIPFILPEGILIIKIGLIAFAFQVPIYMLSKNTVRRKRPSISYGIKQIVNPPDRYSFPSGHCASSMLFTLIVNQYIPSITIYFIMWMVIIFISRIALGLHYLSDAICGMLLGLLSFYIANQIISFSFN